ncbi:MAG: hypothetical protein EPO32_13565 [Anaerolineae bacterium]|nr:MAG: hypothetical protein EPO32_13565 [Anaerolineae bacterium]
MQRIKPFLPLLGALLVAVARHLILIYSDSVPFTADEAVGALMARHILQGRHMTFFYGQAYMGSLFAYVAAAGFLIIGESVDGMRLWQIPMYLAIIISAWWLARLWFADKRVADITAWLLAVPTVLVNTYLVSKFGNYGEILLLGQLVLGLGYLVVFTDHGRRWWLWLLLGLCAGLGWWSLGMSGAYLLPVALLGLWKFRRENIPFYALAATGFFIGSWPWWAYNFQNDWAALHILGGLGRPEDRMDPFQRFLNFSLFGMSAVLGIRAPWLRVIYPLPISIAGVWFYLLAAVYAFRMKGLQSAGLREPARRLLGLFTLLFPLIFSISNFGINATGRYLLPLALPAALMVAVLILGLFNQKRIIGAAAMVFALALNIVPTWMSARSPERLTSQFGPAIRFTNDYDEELIEFLIANDLTRGYSNVWVVFPIAFQSGERVIYSPEFPYYPPIWDPTDNRYPAYVAAADGSDRVAWVTTNVPDWDESVRMWLEEEGLSYREHQIGPYHIFYDFPRALRPEEFGYGDGVTP